MIPVILSGGSGTRLWPISRAQFPKQFCEIFEDTMQNLTLKRLSTLGTPWIVASKSLQNFTEAQNRKAGFSQVKALYEPVARNTAPAIGLLIRVLELENKLDEVVGIFAADSMIEDEPAFYKAVRVAEQMANEGKVVTLGIRPTRPETGYGYIQVGNKKLNQGTPVLKFHEKPDIEKAEKFLADGNYFWNAGMFIFKASTMKIAFESHLPEMWNSFQTLQPDLTNLPAIYKELSSISIDYGIMEKLSPEILSSVPCEIGWSDVGSWDAVAEIMGRAGPKKNPPVEIKSSGNFIFSDSKSIKNKNYSFIGVDDLIVVDTQDAMLISQKGETQNVKNVVEVLNKEQSALTRAHVYEERPWGHFTVLRDEKHFKSKVIQVYPYQQISLQSHAKREEHWVVTKGAGEVILNDQIVAVKAGSYIHIHQGDKHRMKNTQSSVLEFVEVQLGSYFGEDDIVRYQDDYNRSSD